MMMPKMSKKLSKTARPKPRGLGYPLRSTFCSYIFARSIFIKNINFVIFTSHNLDITPRIFIPTSELDLNYVAYTLLFILAKV
nr:MAG TPA: hypothetical protein [Bacteriophage sp.]